MLATSVLSIPLCDPLWCLPKRETTKLFEFIRGPKRHYCSAPHDLKSTKCLPKNSAPGAQQVTYKKFCTNTSNIVLTTMDAKAQNAAVAGVVLLHSSVGARDINYYCNATAAVTLTAAERFDSISTLPDAFLQGRVYNNNKPRGESVDETTGEQVVASLLQNDVAQWRPKEMCNTRSPAELALCLPLPHTQTMAGVDCRTLRAPVVIQGIEESATVSCANGLLSATSAALPGVTPAADPAPCRRSFVPLDAQWAAVAVELAVARAADVTPTAADYEAMRVRIERLTRASKGVPHALRPFVWTYLARDSALFSVNGRNAQGRPLSAMFEEMSRAVERILALPKGAPGSCVDSFKENPCLGFNAIAKDAGRIGAGDIFAESPLSRATDQSLPTASFLAFMTDSLQVLTDKRRFSTWLHVLTALELFFAPERMGPRRLRQQSTEFTQGTSGEVVMYLARMLPDADVFLVRAAMLAKLDPNGSLYLQIGADYNLKSNSIGVMGSVYEAIGQPAADSFKRVYDQAKRVPNVDAIVVANVNVPRVDDLSFDVLVFQTTANHEASLLIDFFAMQRDAEVVHRATDLHLALPAATARLVSRAGMGAFARVYEPRLASESAHALTCSLLALSLVPHSVVAVGGVYAPDANAWFDAVISGLLVLETRAVTRQPLIDAAVNKFKQEPVVSVPEEYVAPINDVVGPLIRSRKSAQLPLLPADSSLTVPPKRAGSLAG